MLFSRNSLINSINTDVEEGIIELLSMTDENIVIYDNNRGKETTFTTEGYITPEFIESKIYISKSANAIISYTVNYVAQILYKNLPFEYFMSLNKLFIVATDEDIIKVEEELVGEYCGFYDNITDLCGIMLFEYNCIIINVGVISSVANEVFEGYNESYIQTDIIHGFWSTVFHEFRHLLLDTNMYLPEDKYPVYLASEDEVEKFGNMLMENMKY